MTDKLTGSCVEVDRVFAGGESVWMGFAKQLVKAANVDAMVDVALGSDFFRLHPGYADLELEVCGRFNV